MCKRIHQSNLHPGLGNGTCPPGKKHNNGKNLMKRKYQLSVRKDMERNSPAIDQGLELHLESQPGKDLGIMGSCGIQHVYL